MESETEKKTIVVTMLPHVKVSLGTAGTFRLAINDMEFFDVTKVMTEQSVDGGPPQVTVTFRAEKVTGF